MDTGLRRVVRARGASAPPRIGTALLATALLVVSVTAVAGPAVGRPTHARVGAPGTYAEATRVDAAAWRDRQDAYLAEATAGPLEKTSTVALIAHAERGRRDAGFDGDISGVTAADQAATLGDDSNVDFTLSTFLTLWIQNHDLLHPGLAAAVKARILGWKYWWTEEPLAHTPGDNYYWTENHQILFAADEYLAGQAFPDDVFPGSGMTGRQHQDHARPQIQRWIELRARYGFSEFLSVPYTAMTFQAVLSLAELADDPELADLASKVLDVILVEVASHLHDGALGSAKGRTYTGNLFDLRGGSTPILADLVFGHGTPRTGGNTVALAVAGRYRPPEVARRIADSQEVAVVRQHQSMPLDPTAPVTDDPVDPDGLPFTGDDGLVVWWGLGAQLSWQVAPLSVRTIETYDLWDTPNFEAAGAGVLESLVRGKSDAELRVLAQSLGTWLNPGLLSAVDTYAWRSPDAMLSTAQSWRAGQRTESALVSQATLDGATSVFTTLPKGGSAGGGYWSGDGAAPRAAQHEDTVVSIYAPQYAAGGTGGFNGYQSYTHAFFPQDRFDDVVQRDGWTFGRKGDGYVALWSWRPTRWAPFDAAVDHPAGVTNPWELIADGGSDNVWINHVGRAADFTGAADPFAAFADSVTASTPTVRPLAGATACPAATPATLASCDHGRADGFLVSYEVGGSTLGFGWSPKAQVAEPPLVVDGRPVALHDAAHRWSSPWATADRDGRYHVEVDGAVLDLVLPVPQPVPPVMPPTTIPGTGPATPVALPATPVAGRARYTG
ncbi:MAG: hypothetical protein JWM47_125 [Acidimicrobiales bacterium]|nr:hypothetical protein [Acidimicrobiales bacterium]